MDRTLESFCLKREGGGFVKKVIACTKADLRRMMHYLYLNAFTSSDYQDAALLSLLWYMFGRASDLTHARKQNVSVDADYVFFVRFIRMKTCEEQGLSLFPDADFAACSQSHWLSRRRRPRASTSSATSLHKPVGGVLDSKTPLLELLDNPEFVTDLLPSSSTTPSALTIQRHVNCLLDRVAERVGVEQQLTPHSFRRGGVQQVNGSVELTDRWMFDRGAWNVSTTNKAFNYVFNTRAGDHKVAKVLSEWSTVKRVSLVDLASFDTQTRELITAIQERLFASYRGLGCSQYNMRQRVFDVVTAVLLTYSLLLKKLNPNSPAMEEQQIIRHQAAVIDHLFGLVKRQDQRLDALEANAMEATQSASQNNRVTDDSDTKEQETKCNQAFPSYSARCTE